jgi:hypothetical protein
MVPPEVTLAVLAEEFPPMQAWGVQNGWDFQLDADRFTIDGRGTHPANGSPVRLFAGVDSYRALPPSWRFVDPVTGEPSAATTPNRGSRNGQSSIIYGVGLICAHFSRTAFAGGGAVNPPHADWQLTDWTNIAGGVQAHTLSEMTDVIDRHLSWSTGWLE